MEEFFVEARQKALRINLDNRIYGTFAEIGAGQEVARFFFQAGGASGTVAKTMSAYDMIFSDSIYGKDPSGRYVCESRLMKMLSKEYDLILRRLTGKRAADSLFFAFADTVTAISYKGNNESHGWVGLRFQMTPGGDSNDVILHVRMLDKSNVLQQQALGIIGVNLIHSCFYIGNKLQDFTKSLMEGLSPERIEVDVIKVFGPAFKGIDNRIMSLQLVKNSMTSAILFDPQGKVQLPSEVIYKKHVLALRGSFRPPTYLNMNMLETGLEQFKKEKDVNPSEIVIMTEITMTNLRAGGELDEKDFLSRVDLLGALGQNVLISNYHDYYKMSSFIYRYTNKKMGIILGVYNLQEIFQTKYYSHLPGGILEALGIVFAKPVRMYVYPSHNPQGAGYLTCKNFEIEKSLQHLFEFFYDNGMIQDMQNFDPSVLHIYSREVLHMIQEGEKDWEKMVPPIIAEMVKKKCLFGQPCSIEQKKEIENEEREELERAEEERLREREREKTKDNAGAKK